MDYPDLDILANEEEQMLRRLIKHDRGRDRPTGHIDCFIRESHDGAVARRLDQAKMVGAFYNNNQIVIGEVLAAGYSYIAKLDAEEQAEAKRQRERKEDKRHDWRISFFTAVAGIAGVVIGFFS